MKLQCNDRSVNTGLKPGYQFEFVCEQCYGTWLSPFEPARLTLLDNAVNLYNSLMRTSSESTRTVNKVNEIFGSQVRAKARARATEKANAYFHECSGCRKGCCPACLPPGAGSCVKCSGASLPVSAGGGTAHPSGAQSCPNCQTRHDAGRFCPECGYDMASVQKTCPGCGTVCARQTRYCPDCGHGF